jgi:Ferritin-like domain
MPHHVTLDVADPDEVIRGAMQRGHTRADFFRRGAIAGGTLIAGGVAIGGLPGIALGKPSASQDVEILNFALLLEYLESEFYVQAVANNKLQPKVLEFARTVRDHELAHVEFLAKALGSKAIGKPTFDFGDTVKDNWKFLATATVLEDTGVTAYDGQGTRLTRNTLAAAATIVSVEARHAAWVRQIMYGAAGYGNAPYEYPAPSALQPYKTKDQVTEAVTATGFIKG